MSFPTEVSLYKKQQSLFPPTEISNVDRMILRNGIKFYLHHSFSIPYPVACQYLQYYKLLYWSGTHTLESIEAGMICRDDIAFIVRYHKDLTRGKILRNPDAQYAISFRAALDQYNLDPVVLISECNDAKIKKERSL